MRKCRGVMPPIELHGDADMATIELLHLFVFWMDVSIA